MATEPGVSTPYSTITPFIKVYPTWVPEEDQERIAAYKKYEDLYWSNPDAYKLVLRGDQEFPIYVPKPRTIVDVTSHYLMKGLRINVDDPEKNSAMKLSLDGFLKREKFYSRFHVAKHSGVSRGDFVFHITADPMLPENSRLSLTSVDPAHYFPIVDDDDVDKIVGVHLVEQFYDPEVKKYRIKKLTYRYAENTATRTVTREEGIWEMDDWGGPKAKKVRDLIPLSPLPAPIDYIPVYHFKNIDWQGQPFGSSELRGFETVSAAINQTVTDEEMALALEGLGVYATDAGPPVNEETGESEDWEISPGRVMEVPGGSFFRRVEGLSTVTPSQDHLRYLEHVLNEGSGTSDVALGTVDVQTAESGIALAIKFMPTLAKIEERDFAGIELLTNMFFDWKKWWNAYEVGAMNLDTEILPTIGEKLPTNRTTMLNELNNMFDRDIIPAVYYRQEIAKLGYIFPDNIDELIKKEKMEKIELQRLTFEAQAQARGLEEGGEEEDTVPDEDTSRNKGRRNETFGTEATQRPDRQANPARRR